LRPGAARPGMFFNVALLLAALLLLTQAAAQQPPKPAPITASPITASPDPASSHFTSDAGVLLVTVKPTAVADYELVIRTLQDALSKDRDPIRSAAAKGWRVLKAAESDTKGNIIYVHVMMPAVPNFDYRPSLLVDELVKDLVPEMLPKYQDAFAAPPTRLTLTELANMSVAPLPAETKKPGGR